MTFPATDPQHLRPASPPAKITELRYIRPVTVYVTPESRQDALGKADQTGLISHCHTYTPLLRLFDWGGLVGDQAC
jgi:hypothetical protein